MTPEEQRIAIAEACGWTQIEPCTCRDGVSRGYGPTPVAHKKHLPDCLNDLNAMHCAEEMLTQDQMIDYSRHVGKLVTIHLPASRAAWMDFKLINSTASQRAEAFLKTIGKWKEDKP